MRQLLDRSANVNARTKDGKTPLLFACSEGNTDAVELLLDKGADVKAADVDGITPLLVAVKKNRSHVIAILLDRGAEPVDESGSH